MKPIAIGINKDLQNRFKRSNKVVSEYLNHVNKQLAEIGLNVPTNELLTNPKKAIKQAYFKHHKNELPKFLNENVILESFVFDFTYIDSKFTIRHNEILSAFNQFGCNDKGLIEPDLNYYATNENQLNFYYEVKAICETLNSFYDNHKNEFTIFLGMIPHGLQYYLETNISNVPYLKVNEYRITQYKK
jgi:hypothetical protein